MTIADPNGGIGCLELAPTTVARISDEANSGSADADAHGERLARFTISTSRIVPSLHPPSARNSCPHIRTVSPAAREAARLGAAMLNTPQRRSHAMRVALKKPPSPDPILAPRR